MTFSHKASHEKDTLKAGFLTITVIIIADVELTFFYFGHNRKMIGTDVLTLILEKSLNFRDFRRISFFSMLKNSTILLSIFLPFC